METRELLVIEFDASSVFEANNPAIKQSRHACSRTIMNR